MSRRARITAARAPRAGRQPRWGPRRDAGQGGRGGQRQARAAHSLAAVRVGPSHGSGLGPTRGSGATTLANTRHFANCEGVSVQGHTNANYRHSYTHSGSSTPAQGCAGCAEGDPCVDNRGTIVSTFTANPTISLPGVPAGLSECETAAVRRFIDTTLRAHEEQHAAAFRTYSGTVNTPYSYRGCASGLDAHVQSLHDGIEAPRKAAADAASAALDPFNVPIPCNCPEPER